ncbi:predicted protein [Phaeodactylum tricornutum CCAP 1055/1]|jgi:hypothetical protein|uniref:Transmembrane protein n=2 Tax=Phaeodactylum tricornutum TaxID=2850 RepID=B7FNX6_PHATC|nr:predicted protein [Phaeodactylum tricornutum CCAP 1055/1]EEC51578.1 predicted protein [Phaeodactylum tricornutum CCAP 1055/1]|eukprot:XP_002177115.1 predicted protein [Phaeodactylum tricornutum CCAP 1055/1]
MAEHSNGDENSVPTDPNDPRVVRQKAEMLVDEDPLLISQSLTYVTDDGSTLHSFESAPFSYGTIIVRPGSALQLVATANMAFLTTLLPTAACTLITVGFKVQFIIVESILVLLMIAAVPVGAHGTVVGVAIGNLVILAWFWYNLVRSVDVTAEGTLRFWIGNIEVDVPFDKVVSIRRVASSMPCSVFVASQPYRGFLSTPTDGVAIVTTVPSTPFWLWPRSAGKPERTCCFGAFSCPRLTVVFSPSTGGSNFIRTVETEMQNFSAGRFPASRNSSNAVPHAMQPDYLDV